MNNNNFSDGCSCDSGCCQPIQEKKKLIIDFLYLDLSVCERCQGAETNLDKAINQVSAVLSAAGFDILVNKINIDTKELAIKYKFLSSPTIRINENDIELDVKESTCKECGDLCGDNVDCRVWVYKGFEYTEPPETMIVNAILKSIYTEQKIDDSNKKEYTLPKNLQIFFEGIGNTYE